MTENTIESLQEKVRAHVASNFLVSDQSPLAADTSLLETSIVDSMGYLEIFKWIHEEFGVEVASDDMGTNNFETIGSIARYLHRKAG